MYISTIAKNLSGPNLGLVRMGATLSLASLLAAPLSVASVDKLVVPKGYQVTVAAEVNNPRQMALVSPNHLFVGSRNAGVITALIDTDNNGSFDGRFTLARGLAMPSGIALWKEDLYIAATGTIYRIKNATKAHLSPRKRPKLEVVYRDLPDIRHHGWKYSGIKQHSDGTLGFYFNVGAPCNLCYSEDPRFASLMRLTLDGDTGTLTEPTVIANGVRNSVGFDWHPDTQRLWFTDNGRDMMGDDIPDDELNELVEEGQHFGYPFVHGNGVVEPSDEIRRAQLTANTGALVLPVHGFGAHRAPLGMHFYQAETFPDAQQHPLFVALHGSWNRSSKVGYKVVKLVESRQGDSTTMIESDFVTGWLEGEKAWGRPADITTDGKGGILIADDFGGVIYRVNYIGE